MQKTLLSILFYGFILLQARGQSNPQVMMQGWYWDYPKTANGFNWADTLRLKTQALSNAGITHMWFPPHTVASFGTNSNGYDPKDLFIGNQTTGLGTRPDLDAMLSAFTAAGIRPVADMIYNHRDGGRPEVNAPVKNYITNFATYRGQNNSANPFPSDRVRMALPLTSGYIGTSRTFYIKVSSATGQYGGKAYNAFFWTSKRGATVSSTIAETKPNGGGDCSQASQAAQLNQAITSGIPSSGCGTVEFAITVAAADINAADSLYMSFVNPNGNYGDQRVYGIWDGGANVGSNLLYQTYTDFNNMPSAPAGTITIGGVPTNVNGNYNNFKPNDNNATGGYLLSNSWEDMQFFYDYDQVLNSADNNASRLATTNLLNNWTYWNYETLGVRGLRMDAVKNFSPYYVTQLLNNMQSTGRTAGLDMVVGEFWDSATNIRNWLTSVRTGLNANAPNPRAFDFPLRYALRDACDDAGNNVRNVIFNSLNGAGESSFNVVTFVNNHDFRDNSGGNALTQNNRNLAYAYILTNNQLGTPTIFYPDYYGYPAASGGQYGYHPATAVTQAGHKTEIDRLLKVLKTRINGSAAVSYLNHYGGTGSAPGSNASFSSGDYNRALIYQLSSVSAVGGKDVIVAINFDSNPLRVNHKIAIQNSVAFGTRFGDILGRSAFPVAVVNNDAGITNSIYIDLPAKSYSVWVQDYVPISVTLASTTACAGGSNTLTANLTGGTAPFTYSFSAGATAIPGSTSLASVTAAGPYSVTVTDDFGVSVTATVNSTFNPLPAATFLPTSNTLTCAQPTVSLTAAGGTSYTLSNGLTNNTDGVFSLTQAGSYTVVVSTASGCTTSATATVESNTTAPALTVSPSATAICLGASVTLTASGAATYTWTPGNTTGATLTVTPGNSITYTITGTGTNGCTATTTASITVNAIPEFGAVTSTSIACFGGTGSFTVAASSGTAPYTFSLNTGTTTNNGQFAGLTAGSYTISLSDANGCRALSTTSVTISQPVAALSATLESSASAVCDGGSVTLTASASGGTVAYQYNFGGGASGTSTSAVVPAIGNNIYSLTVTDANGCTATATTALQGNSLPTLSIAPTSGTVTCANPSLTLTASGDGTGYVWTGGTTGASLTVNAGGTYSVTATAANGCTSTSSVTVNQDNTLPTPGLIASGTLTCSVSAVTLTASGGNTGATLAYTFSGPGVVTSSGSSATVNAEGTYSVTVLNASTGCSNQTTVTVSSNTAAPGSAAFSASNSGTLTCSVTTLTLTASATGSGLSYSFAGSAGALTGTGNALTVNAPGTYTVTITGANGCTTSTTATVESNTTTPNATLNTSQTLTCASPTVTLTATAGASYTLSDMQTNSTGLFSVSLPGTYTVVATGANGCTASATATVESNTTTPTLTVAPASGTITCVNPSLTLTASGDGTGYVWTGGTTGASLTVNAGGTYSVTATAANGCTSTSSVTVNQDNTLPTPGLIASGTLTCSVTAVTLTASGGNTGATLAYAFNGPGVMTSSGSSATVNAEGTYSVTVLNTSTGCSNQTTVTVSSNTAAPGSAAFSASNSGTLTCSVTTLTLTASATGSGLSYSFAGSAGALTGMGNALTVNAPGTYTVTITGSNGCTATATTTVESNTTVPTLSVTPGSGTLTCNNPSLTLTASGTGTAYAWTGGTVGPTLVVSASGTYSVTATAPNGCTSTTAISIVTDQVQQVLAQPAFATNGTAVCPGTNLTLAPTVPNNALSFQWFRYGQPISSGSPTLNLSNIQAGQAGSYVLVITGSCNSASSTAFNLTVNPEPDVVITFPNNATVQSSGGQAIITIPASATGLTYQVFGGTYYKRYIVMLNLNGYQLQQVLDTTSGIFPIDQPGPYTINVIGANGCQRTVQGTINRAP